MQALALVEAEVEEQADRALDQRHLVFPGAVLELPVVEREHERAELHRLVLGREQCRHERTGRRPREPMRRVAVLLERRERADEADSLHAAALEDEIDRLTGRGHRHQSPGTHTSATSTT